VGERPSSDCEDSVRVEERGKIKWGEWVEICRGNIVQ
jgi:hypothetical protein